MFDMALFLLRIVFAIIFYTTFAAFRRTSSADVATVEYEPMVGAWHKVLGNMADESFFSFEGSFAVVGKSDAVGYTKYVSIYCHGWLTKADGCDDIGSFAPNTRQGGEFFGS